MKLKNVNDKLYIHACIHTNIHAYAHKCIHTYIHVHIYICVCKEKHYDPCAEFLFMK